MVAAAGRVFKVAVGLPPCDASCPRSECEDEVVWGMSSEGPNLKRGTPATWGELKQTTQSGCALDQQNNNSSRYFRLLQPLFLILWRTQKYELNPDYKIREKLYALDDNLSHLISVFCCAVESWYSVVTDVCWSKYFVGCVKNESHFRWSVQYMTI